jgi:hypothetical protein
MDPSATKAAMTAHALVRNCLILVTASSFRDRCAGELCAAIRAEMRQNTVTSLTDRNGKDDKSG